MSKMRPTSLAWCARRALIDHGEAARYWSV